jgi:hypothetical protein
MRFLSRLFDPNHDVFGTRRADRSPRRRGAQFRLEALEERDLKSDIPGVTNSGGVLQIQATQVAHNTASVSIDQNNGNVLVTLNGNSVEYSASSVWTINYTGGQGGGDTFTNSTSLSEYATGYGGGNQFTGGSSWNTVVLWGDYNSFDAQGGASVVYAYNGPDDNIVPYDDVSVYSYNAYVWW